MCRYADLLRQDRRYDVLYRVWPGTHRLPLWATSSPGGATPTPRLRRGQGVELFEPLAFSGRAGAPGARGRTPTLTLTRGPSPQDWVKYAHTYCLWGRLLYDPGAGSEQWRPPRGGLGGAGQPRRGRPWPVPAHPAPGDHGPPPSA